jgi:hypothetical protein
MSKPSTIGADSRSGSTSTKSRPLRAVSSRGELIAHAAVFRNDGQLQSLAYEHLDLRLHPPYRSSLDRHDAPYSKIDYARLKAVLPYMMLDNDKDKSGNGLTHLCDLGVERGFMRCFLDYAPPADPWDHRRLLCRVPVADISTVVGVDVTETRIFKAYRSHLATQSTSTALRLFSTPTPVMRIPTYTSTVLDGIIHIQRFEPIPLPTVEFNPGSALFQEAIDELSPEIRHELHLRHCCPWTSVISSSGPVCRCPNYSKDNPRTRLVRNPTTFH